MMCCTMHVTASSNIKFPFVQAFHFHLVMDYLGMCLVCNFLGYLYLVLISCSFCEFLVLKKLIYSQVGLSLNVISMRKLMRIET